MRRLPPLRLLAVFESVVRCGGVRAAATELNVSQPAISQAVRQLEDHVGVRLFDRKTRPARLTDAGELLEASVREGLGRIAETIERIASLQQEEDTVTIACSVGVATYWLMHRLARFSAERPEIAVNVVTTGQGAPKLSPSIDLAIRYGSGKWLDGNVVRLFEERIVPVCHPAYKTRYRVEDGGFRAATLLHVNVEDPTWIGWQEFRQICSLPGNHGKGRHFTNYVQATQAAMMGQGIMLGWKSITGDLVAEGRLVEYGDADLIPEDAFYLVCEPTMKKSAADLAAWLLQSVETAPSSGREGDRSLSDGRA